LAGKHAFLNNNNVLACHQLLFGALIPTIVGGIDIKIQKNFKTGTPIALRVYSETIKSNLTCN
jgi:hypothetical protein